MAEITREIVRFDWVKRDGQWHWAAVVATSVPGMRPQEDGPLNPTQMEEQFGLTLEDVLSELTAGAVAQAEALRVERDKALELAEQYAAQLERLSKEPESA